MNPSLRIVAPSNSPSAARADAFARDLVRHLDRASAGLPHDAAERLRAARVRAVSARKRTITGRVVRSGAVALAPERMGWLGLVGSLVPALALVVGLTLLNDVHNDHRASEVAEVDSALLADTLPPMAYSDPGFAQFLRLESHGDE